MSSLKIAKKALRQKMRQLRDSRDLQEKRDHDRRINLLLKKLIQERKAASVHSFLPMGSEVDLHPLIEELLKNGTSVVCPRTLPKRKLEHLVLKSTHELEDGVFGTKHPAEANVFDGDYDIILVPGLAFDTAGNRLGYGAGYYDSFLENHPEAFKVGVAYPFQVLDKVPTEIHDVKLDRIIC